MINKGISIYDGLVKSERLKFEPEADVIFSFNYGPKVDVVGNSVPANYTIKYKERDKHDYNYTASTSPGLFTTLYRRWFTSWVVELYENNKLKKKMDFEKELFGKKVCVSIDSSSLGDNICWLPVIDEFRKKYNLDLYVSGLWHKFLLDFFPGLRFLDSGVRETNTFAVFGVGWYEESNPHHHKRDPRTITLQQVAGDHLGIEIHDEILPSLIPSSIINSKPNIEGKYVCIATTSTADAKHWHYPGGWQTIVDYLNEIGYKVVLIHQQNNHLSNVIDKTGNIDLLERAIDIYHSEFFIGIGSGLSWLAWALRKPVVMISGFSQEFCEFKTKNYRVINKDVCHGCFNNPSHKFDRGDWLWCPEHKGTERMFECTKHISPEMVKQTIDALISLESLNQ
jgi:autotransporter strand-loop-strand O-heptosyltransferase